MNFTQHPLSAANVINRTWHGELPKEKQNIETYTWAETHPSAIHKGFTHYQIVNLREKVHITSRKPIAADYVHSFVKSELKEFGIQIDDLVWTEKDSHAHDFEYLDGKRISCSSFVYFLRAGEFIKIGRTTDWPHKRISELQTGCPYPITLAGFLDGDAKEESRLHKKFSALRARDGGEWFHAKRELLAYIEKHSEKQS